MNDEQRDRVHARWKKLCDEFQIARDEQQQAYGVVYKKFAAVAKRTGGNPSDEELDRFDKATKKLDDVQARMDAFVKKNT